MDHSSPGLQGAHLREPSGGSLPPWPGRRRPPPSPGAYTATFSRAAPTVAAYATASILRPARRVQPRGAPGPQNLAPSQTQQSADRRARARGEPPEGAGEGACAWWVEPALKGKGACGRLGGLGRLPAWVSRYLEIWGPSGFYSSFTHSFVLTRPGVPAH